MCSRRTATSTTRWLAVIRDSQRDQSSSNQGPSAFGVEKGTCPAALAAGCLPDAVSATSISSRGYAAAVRALAPSVLPGARCPCPEDPCVSIWRCLRALALVLSVLLRRHRGGATDAQFLGRRVCRARRRRARRRRRADREPRSVPVRLQRLHESLAHRGMAGAARRLLRSRRRHRLRLARRADDLRRFRETRRNAKSIRISSCGPCRSPRRCGSCRSAATVPSSPTSAAGSASRTGATARPATSSTSR